jgi:transposase
MMCGRAGALTAQIAALAARIDEATAPAAAPVAPLDQIPGAGRTGAQEITAESGSPGAGPLRTVRAPRRCSSASRMGRPAGG